MSVRVLAVTLTVLALGACSSGSTSPSTSNAPTMSATSSPAATPSPTPTPTTSSTPTTEPGPDLSAIKKYGVSSPECTAVSTILMGATRIGGKANSGTVTQADVDQAFAADVVKAVPADAAALVDSMKAVSAKVVGLDAASALDFLSEFSTALGNLTTASSTICS